MPKAGFNLNEHIPKVIGVFVLVVVIALGGYYFGYHNATFYSLQNITNDGTRADADYSVYWQAWQMLKQNHVDSDKKTDTDLLYGSIGGLAQSFDDPHTVFFPPEEGQKFAEEVNGSFGGIGAEIGNKDGFINVVAPLKASPAERAGLEAGDLILKIGATSTEDLDVNQAITLIRGPIGTTVVLNIFRKEKWVQPRDILIIRERIELPTLDLTFHDSGKIAQIQLYAFNQNASFKFYEAASKALLKGAKGIVLDLRNNPGGYLEVATELAGWFVDRGALIVSERFKTGPDQPFLSSGNGALKKLPIVILINKGSASASEILAGALRDVRGAKIVGEKSYGKGTVQELMDLKDGSSLKITIAHWVMPKGQILDHNGIVPDFEVIPTDEQITEKKDVQLDKALEVMRAELNGVALPAVAVQ